jgi:ectoine hydroxylase-related dioxygenase (phytanoyl-CoA dioxygenase family)
VQTELTDEQIEQFQRDGFLALDAIAAPDEIEALRVVYDRMFAEAETAEGDRLELAGGDGDAPRLPQIVNPERYAPELLETQAMRNATAIARQLLGPDAEPAGNHAIMKPPRHGAPTPWHQDEAYWNPAFDHNAISVWMPLQPATLENGCMQFVPGSQALDIVPHRLIDADAHGLVVENEEEAAVGAVPCPIPAGGATIHSGRTLHYAGPNGTDEPRRALIMGFRAAPTPVDEPHDYYWQRAEWYA